MSLSFWSLRIRQETAPADVLEVAIPVLVGVGFLGASTWHRRLDLGSEHRVEILGTAALMGILAIGVVLWEQFLLTADGVAIPIAERGQAALNGLAIGLLAGGVAGSYRALTKQELRDRAAAADSFREIFEKVDDALLVHDYETSEVLEFNEKAVSLFGYADGELSGMGVPELTGDHPEFDMAAATEKIDAAKAGRPQRFDWPIKLADGETRWVEVTLKSAELDGEDRLLAMLRDVDDQRRRQDELLTLADARRDFQEIFEKADVGIALTDPETRTIGRVNQSYADLFGYGRDELVDMDVAEITAEDPKFDDDQALDVIRRALDGDPQQFDWPMRRKDGSRFWAEVSLKRATIGGEVRLLTFIRDASQRKEREQKLESLAEAREDFQEIFEKADVGIALNDPETGTVGRVNPRYADMLGYDPGELEGLPIEDVSAEDPDFDQDRPRELMEQALTGDPQQFDWPVKRKDGSELWTEVSLKHATIGGESRLLAFVRDISDRRRRQQEREKFWEIYRKADHAIGLNDPETGTIVEANPKYGEILGYEPKKLEGMPIDAISAESPEFSQEQAMEVIQAAMAGEPQSLDWLLERKDGSSVWVAVSLKRATIGDEQRLLVFFQDVTERKEREEELDRHRSEMEFFNSLLRHDVLNGITVIRTHGQRLVDRLDGEEREHAETVVEWADNTTGVVERVRDVLQTLTGDQEAIVQPVDLSATLRAEVDKLDSAYSDATVEADIPDDVHVLADDLLGDVFRNVLTNAVDHNDADGLTVMATVDPGPETTTVRIADTGSGIPDDDKEAVFRRGETGHVKKTGSGFGLFFVDSMVEAYGGDVYVEDNQPEGTAVVTELSSADD